MNLTLLDIVKILRKKIAFSLTAMLLATTLYPAYYFLIIKKNYTLDIKIVYSDLSRHIINNILKQASKINHLTILENVFAENLEKKINCKKKENVEILYSCSLQIKKFNKVKEEAENIEKKTKEVYLQSINESAELVDKYFINMEEEERRKDLNQKILSILTAEKLSVDQLTRYFREDYVVQDILEISKQRQKKEITEYYEAKKIQPIYVFSHTITQQKFQTEMYFINMMAVLLIYIITLVILTENKKTKL